MTAPARNGADAVRAASRRPIAPAEVPHLEALGAHLSERRRAAGLSRAALARAAGLSPPTVGRLEVGTRRTRATALARLARALAGPEEAPALAAELVALAGPALAPESGFAERVERRRERRARRTRRRAEATRSRADERARAERAAERTAAVRDLRRAGFRKPDELRLALELLEAAGMLRPQGGCVREPT